MVPIIPLLSGFLRAKARALIWLMVLAFAAVLFFLVNTGTSGLVVGVVAVCGALLIALACGLVWFWSRVFSDAMKATREPHNPSDRSV